MKPDSELELVSPSGVWLFPSAGGGRSVGKTGALPVLRVDPEER